MVTCLTIPICWYSGVQMNFVRDWVKIVAAGSKDYMKWLCFLWHSELHALNSFIKCLLSSGLYFGTLMPWKHPPQILKLLSLQEAVATHFSSQDQQTFKLNAIRSPEMLTRGGWYSCMLPLVKCHHMKAVGQCEVKLLAWSPAATENSSMWSDTLSQQDAEQRLK